MAGPRWMRRFARWHIWLGWLIGVPLIMWTLSGLVMVIKPIEEVRGNHLRIEQPVAVLPPDTNIAVSLPQTEDGRAVESVATAMSGGRPVTTLTYADGETTRFWPDGSPVPDVSEFQARRIVAEQIVGGGQIVSSELFSAEEPPLDFRRAVAAWRIILADETYVYVAQSTGEIAAVRTKWWRIFDFMWGIHIMDLQDREDTSHPILIAFAGLSLLGVLIGTALLFRRRRKRSV